MGPLHNQTPGFSINIDPEISYSGSSPVPAADLIQAEVPDKNLDSFSRPLPDISVPEPENNSGWKLPLSIGAIIFFLVAFIACVSILAARADCKVGLCGHVDHSSLTNSIHPFKVFPFIAPLSLSFVAFSGALLAVTFLAVSLFLSSKKPSPDGIFSLLNSQIALSARAFFFHGVLVLIILAAGVFVLAGLAASWRTAGSFLFGLAAGIGISILSLHASTRASSRVALALQDSTGSAFQVALRSAAVTSLSSTSFTLLGLSLSYILLRDIRSTRGFTVGMTLTSICFRVSGALFSNVPSNCSLPTRRYRDYQDPTTAIHRAGQHIEGVVGISVHSAAVLAAAVTGTAMLGAGLPYLTNNSYALCVLNHLELDQLCPVFDESLSKASFAVSLCRLDDFHEKYPRLSVWQSNSLFVGLPFLFAVVSTVITILTTLFFPTPPADVDDSLRAVNMDVVQPFLRGFRNNIAISVLLSILGAVGLCWGYFGGRSPFYNTLGADIDRHELPVLTTDNAGTRCRPAPEYPTLSTVAGLYRPLDSFGEQMPPPTEVAWRLFLCICLGLVAGVVIGLSYGYSTSPVHSPSMDAFLLAKNGLGDPVVCGLGTSALATATIIGVAMVAVVGSFALFRAYGVGLAGIGMLCTVGQICLMGVLRVIAKEAEHISKNGFHTPEIMKRAEVLQRVGECTDGWSKGSLSGSTLLSSAILYWLLIQQSGLIPGSFELAGTVTGSPTKHINDVDPVDLMDYSVLMSFLAGIVVPFLFCGALLLAASQVSHVVGATTHAQMNESESAGDDGVLATLMKACRKVATRESLLASVLPVSVSVVPVLMVGLATGKRGLATASLGMLISAGMLSVLLSTFGSKLEALQTFKIETEDVAKRMSTGIPENDEPEDRPWRFDFQEWFGSGVGCFLLSSMSIANIVVEIMTVDGRRGWIAAIVGVGWVWIAFVYHGCMSKRKSRLMKQQEEVETPGYLTMKPVGTSPFFEASPRIEEQAMNPASALRHAAHEGVHVSNLIL